MSATTPLPIDGSSGNATREEAAYAERIRAVVLTGRADIAAGHYVEGIDAFLDAMDERMDSHR